MRGVGADPDGAVAALIADAEMEAAAEEPEIINGAVKVASVRRAAREAANEMDELLEAEAEEAD